MHHRLTAKRGVVLALMLSLAPALRSADASAPPEFAAVASLFSEHCLDCHAVQEPEGKLVMETFEDLMKGGESGAALVPGKSADSLLVKMIEGRLERDGKKRIMPPGKRKKLQPDEIAVIKGWIDAGAPPPKEPVKVARRLSVPKITPTVPPVRSIQALAFSNGQKLIAVARYAEVDLVSSESRSVVRTLQGHRGAVNAVAFSADGRRLAAASGEPALFGEVRLWDPSDGSLIRTFEGHSDALYSVAISPDGKVLATGSYDQKIKLWGIQTGKELQTLSAHNGAIFDLAFRPDGKILASASGDRTVKLWNVATGKRVETLSQPLKEQFAVAWSPDGNRLAAGGADNRIRVWEVSESAAETSNPLLLSKFAHEGAILNLLYSPDGAMLVSSAEDRRIKVWDSAQMTEKRAFEMQPDNTPGLIFLGSPKSVAAGRLDGTLAFYDAETGKPLPLPAPGLSRIEPRGLWNGMPVVMTLFGTNLVGITNVTASNPGLSVTLLSATNANEARAMVEAGVTLPRGAYELSVKGPGGESSKIKVYVDNVPQLTEARARPPRSCATSSKAGPFSTTRPRRSTAMDRPARSRCAWPRRSSATCTRTPPIARSSSTVRSASPGSATRSCSSAVRSGRSTPSATERITAAASRTCCSARCARRRGPRRGNLTPARVSFGPGVRRRGVRRGATSCRAATSAMPAAALHAARAPGPWQLAGRTRQRQVPAVQLRDMQSVGFTQGAPAGAALTHLPYRLPVARPLASFSGIIVQTRFRPTGQSRSSAHSCLQRPSLHTSGSAHSEFRAH
jgi:WD40 repeat protein